MEQIRVVTDPVEWGRRRMQERAEERRTFLRAAFGGFGFTLFMVLHLLLAIVEFPVFFRRIVVWMRGNRNAESWGFIFGIAVGGACIGWGSYTLAQQFGWGVGNPAFWLFAATNGISFVYELSRCGNRSSAAIVPSVMSNSVAVPAPQSVVCNPDDVLAKLVVWETLYSRYLGKEYNFSNVVVPPKRDGFERLIVIPEGLTNMELWECLKKLMPCYTYWSNLNTITSVRTTNATYAIWVRDRVEADEEWKNNSANDLQAKQVTGVTLAERLAHELAYFDETGQHLDVRNWTLCTGSRHPDGDVPGVSWYSGRLDVSWCNPSSAHGSLRVREAVS